MMQKDSEVFTAHHCLLSPKHNVLFWGLGGSFFSQEGQQEDPQEDPQERSLGRSLGKISGKDL